MKPIANLDVRLAEEIPQLTIETLRYLKSWRQSMRDFEDSPDYERTGRHPADAQSLAAGDPRRQQATAYTTYYREQYAACAAALTALRGVREDLKQR